MQKHTQTLLLIVSLLFVFLLTAGCVSQNSPNGNTTTGTASTSTSAPVGGTGSGSIAVSGTTKEFTVMAKQFSFEPATITVDKGDTVIIHATSTDVEHGFALPAFGVSQQLPVGQEVTFQFVANQAGTFPFFCNVFCGEDHGEMRGSLVVR